jgi:diaminopimelate decarboxylase
MTDIKETLISISSENRTKEELVSILVLTCQCLNINTISEMARLENKTPRGITISKKYAKIKIGKQTFAVKGVDNSSLPF